MSLFLASLAVLVGLVLVHRVVRGPSEGAVASWTVIGLFLGTGLLDTLTLEADPIPGAMGFVLASVAMALWWPFRSEALSARALLGDLMALMAVAIPGIHGNFLLPQPWRLEERLFGSPRGLLFESPFLWTGIVGLAILARREWRAVARPVVMVASVVLASIALQRSLADAPFHAALPALALGTGAFLSGLLRVVANNPGLPLVAAGAALTLWNGLFMEQYRSNRIPRDLPVSFSQVAETNAEILARAVGSPTAWPANWLFGLRHHVTPAKFDVVVGRGLLTTAATRAFSLDDPQVDPSLLAEGWGAKRSWEGVGYRGLVGSARLLLPLDDPRPPTFWIRAAGSGDLSVEINSTAVAIVKLESGFSVNALGGASSLWRPGVNEVRLTHLGAGEARIAGFGFGAGGRP
jgi:hypothetical protein